ncbi:MAG: ATP-dependent Clp protease proteolytic subunit [Bacillota bacterium]|nr:ATP-dependent Clp protease proteolytic subunit [Bacillota bacterium]
MILNPVLNGEVKPDIYSKLLEERKILLFNEVDDDLACSVIAQLLYLESVDPEKDIYLYINSPGGSVSAGFGIYDTMHSIKCNVVTVCVGIAASMGAVLLSGGTKGKRFVTKNSEVMIHQVLGGVTGQATNMELSSKHLLRTKDRLNQILAENSGQPLSIIEKDTDRDNWMSAEEAIAYGIADKIEE